MMRRSLACDDLGKRVLGPWGVPEHGMEEIKCCRGGCAVRGEVMKGEVGDVHRELSIWGPVSQGVGQEKSMWLLLKHCRCHGQFLVARSD